MTVGKRRTEAKNPSGQSNKVEQRYDYVSAMRKYAQFTGRSPRREYWLFVLVYAILSAIFTISSVGVFVLVQGAAAPFYGWFYYARIAVWLVHIIPGLTVGVRRLHDIGKSGWWYLIGLVPVVGWIMIILWTIRKSEAGDNDYGPNPCCSVESALNPRGASGRSQ